MRKVLIGAAVTLGLAVIVFASIRSGGQKKGVEVYIEPATTGAIEAIVKARGRVDPRVKVDVSAHVIARIEKLYVVEGQEIAAGDPFLDLERDAFVAVRDRAAAQLQIATSRVAGAKLDLADAERELERARKLVADGVVPPDEEIRRQLARDAAKLGLDQAHEAVTQARAELTKAADDLAKTTIHAPLSGRVVALSAEEGEVVVSGTMNNAASVIGTIADLSEILVEVDVDENDIVRVGLGQATKVKVDALREQELAGKVVEIGSSGFSKPTQPDVTFFKVKILLDAPPESLRPGMSARAEIAVDRRDDAVLVPIGAVASREREEGAAKRDVDVVFVEQEGKAVEREVEVGISDDLHAEIVEGVSAGERVVTGPYRQLKDLDDGALIREKKRDDEGAEVAADDEEN
jgi:HlyD family secretion protein